MMNVLAILLASATSVSSECVGVDCSATDVEMLLQTRSEANTEATSLEKSVVGKSQFDIGEKWMTWDGVKYNRYDAIDASLAAIGMCQGICYSDGITLNAKIKWTYHIGPDDGKHALADYWLDENIRESQTVTIHADGQGEGQAGAYGKLKDFALDAHIEWNNSYTGEYDIRKFSIQDQKKVVNWLNGVEMTKNFQLKNLTKKEMNKRARFLDIWGDIEKAGNKARLCTAVWVVMQSPGREVAASCLGGGLDVKFVEAAGFFVNGSSCRERTWHIPANSILAYEAADIVWVPDGNDGQQVIGLKPDRFR